MNDDEIEVTELGKALQNMNKLYQEIIEEKFPELKDLKDKETGLYHMRMGPSGPGKTASFISPLILEKDNRIEVDEEFYQDFKEYCEKNGLKAEDYIKLKEE